jgi:hypothetical protein
MKNDAIEFEILQDGTISIKTDQISGTNHVSADKLLRELFDMVGGEVKTRKRTRLEVGHAIHEHSHGEHTHTH